MALSRRHWLVCIALAVVAVVGGCGGGSSDSAKVRIINASLDYGALDVYFDGTIKHSNVAVGSTSGYIEYEVKSSKTLKVTRAGSAAAVLEATVSTAGNTDYVYVFYGNEGNLRLSYYTENEADASSGKAKLRVLNGSTDSGALDLYASASATEITDLIAKSSSISPAGASAWVEFDKGTYKVWLTASGDKSDIRLAIPSVTLDDKKLVTIIVTPSKGGALVHAQVLVQQGAVSSVENASARLRLVAGLDQGTRVTVNSTATQRLLSNTSPSISSYVLVPKGSTNLTVQSNATEYASLTMDLAAGTDNTLLAYGTATQPIAKVMSDDNRAPTSSSKTKMRLINGFAPAVGPLTLSADYFPVASSIAVGDASPYAQISSGGYSRLDVTEPGSSAPLYLASDVTLSAQSVYTVFMLGSRAVPVGILRKDR